MISEAPDFAALAAFGAQVCVIGGGPVGLVTALALARRGRRVLLLESGGRGPRAAAQALSQAENLDPATHHAPEITVARRLGGASNLWGGRCLPFDPVDFAARPWLAGPSGTCRPGRSGRPSSRPGSAPACALLAAGDPVFAEPLPGVAADPAFGFESLERWSNRPRIQELHGAELAAAPEPPGRARGDGDRLRGRRRAGGSPRLAVHVEGRGRGRVAAPIFVLAAGGNESTRLLLAAQARTPGRFGGPGRSGGATWGTSTARSPTSCSRTRRCTTGSTSMSTATAPTCAGGWCRRRRPRRRAARPTSPSGRWCPRWRTRRHRSGPLSAVFLALSVGPLGRRLIAEPIRLKHVGPPPYRPAGAPGNVLRDLPRTLGFAPAFLWRNRVAKLGCRGSSCATRPGATGSSTTPSSCRDPESRLTLADADRPARAAAARIRLAFSQADAAAVVRAHDALGGWLGAQPARAARAPASAGGARGGGARRGQARQPPDRHHPHGGATGARAVVDGDCRAFDAPNLYVVSTAVLPTSGQANPTLTAVQLGLRLAARLAG